MKKYLKNIWNFIGKMISKFSLKDWFIVILLLIAVSFAISSRYYYKKSLYPVIVYNDSVEVYKNRLNEEYNAKNLYIQTIDQLKKSNSDLFAEVKSLKDNPLVITKTKLETHIDTLYMDSDTIIHNQNATHELKWHKTEDDGKYHIAGYTTVKNDFSDFQTTLTSLDIPTTLTLDVIEKDNQLKIIGKTDNPYVSITNYDGVVLDPSKSSVIKKHFPQKRWGIGPTIGVGIDKNLKFTPYIGVGVSYNIFTW